MDFAEETDRLQLQYLAGGDIVAQPPLYAPNGECLFVMSGETIHAYSTVTGERIRQLVGASSKLISMEFEPKQTDILVGCSATQEVLRWDWRTGQLQSQLELKLPEGNLLSFNLMNFYSYSETACAFVTIKCKSGPVQWFVINTSTGSRMKVPLTMHLTRAQPLVAVDHIFKNIVIAQGFYVYFVNYTSWTYARFKNANQVPVTVVRVHPTEEMVATGDEVGKIFLWRQFVSQHEVKTSLYHWHHTGVTSIAFSASGSSFYSSGHEAVLIKWNVQYPDLRDVLPRIVSIIRHIAVSADNTQVAICTADNGVQIVGNDNKLKSTLQEFTYISDDKTDASKFPVGLRLNPRTNTLVLNGRVGHLQFYSAYSKNLLYNMDIVMQNRLSMETGKILYNIRVTKAAFNIDWMATGEVFNDEEHLPELRLKFWKYSEETQSYTLNTNIELPHEGGFKAIEFSSDAQMDNLLCATIGEDNIIKMWSLEESDNIYKQGKVWYCIAQTSYKEMPIESISFSQDGSLLAAGFGNTLCIYKADNLKLKAALTGSAGYDGCVQKAQVRVAHQSVNGSRNEIAEQRKKILQLFSNLLESNEETLIKELQKSLQLNNKKNKNSTQEPPLKPLKEIDEKQKSILYNKILQMQELNLFQKVLLFQKLGIRANVHPQWQSKMVSYLSETVASKGLQSKANKVHAQLHRLSVRERFKAKYRLQQFAKSRKRNYDAEITQQLVPILSVLNLSENSKQPQLTNGTAEAKANTNSEVPSSAPLPALAEISHVQFAAGEYAHLVCVCTESRVLIWNLLTLRLQSVLKLSVKHLTFDPQTNLIAAFTKTNDLHVFQPNVPLPIYQRRNLPNLYGATWLPRRHPKQRSINLDWQAQSTLYFLTKSQELMYLGVGGDADSDAPPAITFNKAAVPVGLRYTTFGTYATKQNSEKQSATGSHGGPLVLGNSGKNAVKSLIEMSTHTMPPLSLLCGDFVQSLVKPAESSFSNQADNSSRTTNGGGYDVDGDAQMNGHLGSDNDDDDDDDEDDDESPNAAANATDASRTRKQILAKSEEISQNYSKSGKTHVSAKTQLQRIASQNIELEF